MVLFYHILCSFSTVATISKIPATQDAINHLFIDDEQFAATFDNDVTIKNTLTAEIDGVAAREITYLTSDGIGYQSYFYAIGTAIYRIDFSWRGETSGNNQRFFDAIIDSYKITSPETATVTDTSGKLLCKNISVDAIMQMTADEVREARIINLLIDGFALHEAARFLKMPKKVAVSCMEGFCCRARVAIG